MKCVKKLQIEDRIYEAKTDFRTAILCNEIAKDKTIGDLEKSYAILYVMFGDKALEEENLEDSAKLLEWCLKFLSCGLDVEVETTDQPDMDYVEDMDFIVTSFQSDYGINLDETEMHWWKFFNLMNGLSNSELGNCCVLNRVRNLRNFDVSEIKDSKEREKIIKAKKSVELKKYKKENNLTEEQEESMKKLNELLGL